MGNLGYQLYLLFTMSWFLHLPSRIPLLGSVRFDLVLVGILTCICIYRALNENDLLEDNESSKYLMMLILYIVISIPLVRWPGSVVKTGAEQFIKAVVFFFFSVYFIRSEKQLKIFLFIFLACQSIRVFEPLYLHITEGYWGSETYVEGETMDRLAGSPYDIVNPNGLAFIIVTIIPFIYYLCSGSMIKRVICYIALPILVYALILTSSRTGMICFVVIVSGILMKSRNKILLVPLIMAAGIFILLHLSPAEVDRYASIFDSTARNAATAQGRLNFTKDAFFASLDRPIFGHGLGTSVEVNWEAFHRAQITHNLYIEVAQELGYVGLTIFLLFMKSIVSNFQNYQKSFKARSSDKSYLTNFSKSMNAYLLMTIVFSFASYGLSTYAWYLFGGLSVVFGRLISQRVDEAT